MADYNSVCDIREIYNKKITSVNMGRPKKNPVHNYFHFDSSKSGGVSTCKQCGTQILGKFPTNLKNHISSIHPETYLQLMKDYKSDINIDKKSTEVQQKIDEISQIKVNITGRQIVTACVELTTVNGRPFSLIDDSGFRKILNPLLSAVKPKISVTPETIKNEVNLEAAKLKSAIAEDVRGKMVSLKVDGASRLDRAFLGINMQYIENQRIVLRTLALLEIKEKHTGEHLKDLILETCAKFGISAENIYSITTDNGANMIKTVKLIRGEASAVDEDCDEDDVSESGDEENEVITVIINDDSQDGKEENAQVRSEELLEAIDEEFVNSGTDYGEFSTEGMRCAAHTLNLAVQDSLRQIDLLSNLTEVCRALAKKLRTQTYIYLLKKENLKKPILDCCTRWNSTLDMIERLLELKEFCIDISKNDKLIKKVILSKAEWQKAKELVETLLPAKICMKKLQCEQLVAGEFYSSWLCCKEKLVRMENEFSKILLENINNREKLLLKSNAFLTAVFMDSRYKTLIDQKDQFQKSLHYLKKLYNHLKKIGQIKNTERSGYSDEMNYLNNPNSLDSLNEVESADNNDLEIDEIESLMTHKKNVLTYEKDEGLDIKTILLNYFKQKRVSTKTDVFKYWNNLKECCPELYLLAKTTLALPMTQVSVERLFSGMKFVLTPQRANISNHLFENQMFIRMNKQFINVNEGKILKNRIDETGHKRHLNEDEDEKQLGELTCKKQTKLFKFLKK